jgi:hypothetical protein
MRWRETGVVTATRAPVVLRLSPASGTVLSWVQGKAARAHRDDTRRRRTARRGRRGRDPVEKPPAPESRGMSDARRTTALGEEQRGRADRGRCGRRATSPPCTMHLQVDSPPDAGDLSRRDVCAHDANGTTQHANGGLCSDLIGPPPRARARTIDPSLTPSRGTAATERLAGLPRPVAHGDTPNGLSVRALTSRTPAAKRGVRLIVAQARKPSAPRRARSRATRLPPGEPTPSPRTARSARIRRRTAGTQGQSACHVRERPPDSGPLARRARRGRSTSRLQCSSSSWSQGGDLGHVMP